MTSRLTLCLLALFVFTSTLTHAADESKSPKIDDKEIKELILELPSASRLRLYLEDTRNKKSSAHSVKYAQGKIDRAKAIVPKLRKSIKTGKSVLEYPGLIAKGDIKYSEYSKEYSIYIGVYVLEHEGREPYDFRLIFDEKGIIKSIKDVAWKH